MHCCSFVLDVIRGVEGGDDLVRFELKVNPRCFPAELYWWFRMSAVVWFMMRKWRRAEVVVR